MHRHSIRNTSNAMDVVSKTITYIKSNYSRNLSNKMLSDLTGYHEYHLNRLFVRHTGTTVHRYILNLRINRAKDLLLNTSLSLAAIAECVGFNSNTHFSEYFKQVVGIPPMEFRKRMKNIWYVLRLDSRNVGHSLRMVSIIFMALCLIVCAVSSAIR